MGRLRKVLSLGTGGVVRFDSTQEKQLREMRKQTELLRSSAGERHVAARPVRPKKLTKREKQERVDLAAKQQRDLAFSQRLFEIQQLQRSGDLEPVEAMERTDELRREYGL